MQAIVDKTFFYGLLEVPQLSSPAVQSDLSFFIAKYEKDYLLHMLGYEQYTLLSVAGTQALTDLLNGKEYLSSYYGFIAKWDGLKRIAMPASGGMLAKMESPIANYIYFHYMRAHASVTTPSGEKEVKSKNSEPVSHRAKLARVWNDMVFSNRMLEDFLKSSLSVYPSFGTYYNSRRYKGLTSTLNVTY